MISRFSSATMKFGQQGYVTMGYLFYPDGWGIEVGLARRKDCQEGEYVFAYFWRLILATYCEWQDFGWLAFSPVRIMRRDIVRFSYDGGGEWISCRWTGRAREWRAIQVKAFGYQWWWEL